MIALSAAVAGLSSVRRLLDPQPVAHLGWVAAAGLIGFAGNELVAVYRIRVVLTGSSSKQSALVSRLSASKPALLASSTGSEQRLRARQRQRQRRLTVEQTQQLIAEYEAGAGIKELAARWDLHRTTVAARLRRAGVQLRRQGVPDTLLNEAIQLYGEGWSCQRLAGRYGCDAETARQTLRRAGVRMRAPWDRT